LIQKNKKSGQDKHLTFLPQKRPTSVDTAGREGSNCIADHQVQQPGRAQGGGLKDWAENEFEESHFHLIVEIRVKGIDPSFN
jgi:hypothetical protein